MADNDADIGVSMSAGARADAFDDQETQEDNTLNAAEAVLQDSDPMENRRITIIPPKPDSPDEEKQYIKELEAKANLEGIKMGQIWYVVSTKWWKAWKEYTQYDWSHGDKSITPPGPINNEPILDAGGEGKIKKTAMENYDYVIISEEMWLTLESW
jgi:hypothetical protein